MSYNLSGILMLICFCLPFTSFFSIKKGEKICEKGVPGKGVIKSCRRISSYRTSFLLGAQYLPEIEFYLGENKVTARCMGVFRKPPGKKGDTVNIIYWNKYDEHVILVGFDYRKSYVYDMLRECLIMAFFFAIWVCMYIFAELL